MKKIIINILSFIFVISICFSISNKHMFAYAENEKWDLKYGPDAEFSVDTTQKSRDGEYSIKIQNKDYGISRVEKTFKVKPHTKYRATVMAKCTSYVESEDPAHTQFKKFGAVLATAQGLPYGTSYKGGVWKELSYYFNSGATENYTLALYNSANKGTVYFSDFKLEEITEDSNKWNLCVVYLKNIKVPYTENGEEKIFSATFCKEDMDFCTETINELYSFMNQITDGRMDINSIDFYECDETVESAVPSTSGGYNLNNNDDAIKEKLDTIIADAKEKSGKTYDQIILVSPFSTAITGKLGSNYLYSDIIHVYINHLEMRNTLIATFVHEILHSVEHVSMQIDPDHTAELHAVDGEYSEYYRIGQNGLPGNCTWFSDYSRRTTHDGRGLHENAFYKHGKIIYANGKTVSEIEKTTYEKTDIGTLKIDRIPDKTYTGEEIKPIVTIKDGDVTLKSGTDYNISYSCNTDIGIASVIVEGIGKYSGTAKQNFNIIPEKTELSAVLSGNNYNLSWKASKGATGYEIYGSTENNKFSLLKVIDVTGANTDLSTTIACNGKEYKFKIRAYKKVYPQTFYSEHFTPTAIEDYTLGGRASNALRLNWTKNATADGYIIENYKDGKWSSVARITNPETTTYSLTGLESGTYYTLRMKAYKTDGDATLYSKNTSVLSACTRPSKITDLEPGGRAADALRLNWSKNTSADGYIVEQYKNGKWTQIAKIPTNATTTYRVTGLVAGTTYKFRMIAYRMEASTALYSEYTPTLSLCTSPSKVTGLKLSGRESNTLRLSWTKNTSADGYIIEQYKDSKWVRIAKITSNATTTYNVTGLAAGTAYKFRMRAYKMDSTNALYSAYTSTFSARTNPSNVAGFKLGGRAAAALRLNWTKNTSADGYIVEQYKSGKWVRIAKITSNATTTYRVTGLAASTQYKFRVKAYKMSGKTALYSGYTSTLSAYTNPSKVANLKITGKTTTALRLGWSKNTSADGYIIEMYKSGKWVRAAKIASNATVTFRKTGLTKGTTYKFRVRAYNMVGKTALYSEYVYITGKTNN